MFLLALETALRGIRKTPGVSVLVVLMIGLGIGVLMPMMAVRDVYSDDPLPDRSGRLYRVLIDNWRQDEPYWSQWPDFPPTGLAALDANALVASDIPTRQALMYASQQYIRPFEQNTDVRPRYTQVRVTSRDFFSMFGAPFAYGAAWDAAAERNAVNVAVINSVTNDRLFGGIDSTGRELSVGAAVYTVVGVLDAWEVVPRVWDLSTYSAPIEGIFVPVSGFRRPELAPNFWTSLDPRFNTNRFDLALLNSETLFASLWVELDTPAQVSDYRAFLDGHWHDQNALGRLNKPKNNRLYSAAQWVYEAPFHRNVFGWYNAFIALSFLFLAVCLLNGLSLLLSKFLSGTKEISVTRALGAPQRTIFVQHLLEVGILGVAGGFLGIGIAQVGLLSLRRLFFSSISREARQVVSHTNDPDAFFAMDTSMLVTAIGISIGAAVVAAVYPAWRACRIAPAEYLKIN